MQIFPLKKKKFRVDTGTQKWTLQGYEQTKFNLNLGLQLHQMKNSFSLSSQQMQQKLCLCQQVIQYDRSESIELNSWWNFYTYSIYSLEMRGPLLSEAPDILSTGRCG